MPPAFPPGARAVWILLGALSLAGCLGPRSRAERIELDKSPLRDARAGELCRYRSIRDGKTGEAPVEEEWTLRVVDVANDQATLAVTVLGPPRSPPAPSPREPGYELSLPTKEDGFSGALIVRLFHSPDLSAHGMRAVLDRDVARVAGSHEVVPLVVDGRTREAHVLTLTIEDPKVRATYRIVVVDQVPACGIYQADLDETWSVVSPDGEKREERRHDHLTLVESRS